MEQKTANIISISRNRISTDGAGVRTLIAFGGCPLKCKYCINDFCHDSSKWKKMTLEEVYSEAMKDELYYKITNGGITFGGGEPCLQQNASAIMGLIEMGLGKYDLAIETSLHAPVLSWIKLADVIKTWYVDVKDLNSAIYKDYCGGTLNMVMFNLGILKERVGANGGKIIIRVPHIADYNTHTDVDRTVAWLNENGFENIDEFYYKQ